MMESIADLRRQLAELAPDGRDIGRSLYVAAECPPGILNRFRARVLSLVRAIHDAKPRPGFPTRPPFFVLRLQLHSRKTKSGISTLSTLVNEQGECFVCFNGFGNRPFWRFKVSPTWNPEPLTEHPERTLNRLVLLSKEECGSVPFGRVYSVRYVVFGGDQECRQLAVQATTGGTLRLVYGMEQAEAVAEELYRARFAELAGLSP